jgi:hypothetical protein
LIRWHENNTSINENEIKTCNKQYAHIMGFHKKLIDDELLRNIVENKEKQQTVDVIKIKLFLFYKRRTSYNTWTTVQSNWLVYQGLQMYRILYLNSISVHFCPQLTFLHIKINKAFMTLYMKGSWKTFEFKSTSI